jgi:hypothetical protein
LLPVPIKKKKNQWLPYQDHVIKNEKKNQKCKVNCEIYLKHFLRLKESFNIFCRFQLKEKENQNTVYILTKNLY